MRVSLRELLDTLGVGYEMGPYETCPWSVYDAEKTLTCNAEVRMNEDGNALEAEIMLIHDTPQANGSALELVFRLFCKPAATAAVSQWEPYRMILKGEDKSGAFHDWDKKSCDFFSACVQELKMDKAPDIEELIKKHFSGDDDATMMRGGSSKAPKIKPQALLGMKGGRGF